MDQTIKNAPREKPASIVEQSLHIQEVNALQRMQSVSSVEKRNIMALFANTKAKEGMLMSYKPSPNQNYTVEDYSPSYVTATVHHLKMVMVKTLNHPRPLPHIRPLWLSKEVSSQIFQIPYEVDTGASSSILPLYKANKCSFGTDLKLGQQTINLKGYNDSPLENLGSCSVYLYHGKKTYKVSGEMADSKGHMILGRQQALLMA